MEHHCCDYFIWHDSVLLAPSFQWLSWPAWSLWSGWGIPHGMELLVLSRNSGQSLRALGGLQLPQKINAVSPEAARKWILHHNWKRLGSRPFPIESPSLGWFLDGARVVLEWEPAKNLRSISQASDSEKLLTNVCCFNLMNVNVLQSNW